MALVVKRIDKFEHPEEPGIWFELSVPLSVADLKEIGNPESLAGAKFAVVLRCLKSWSYEENGEPLPLTAENLDRQDAATFNMLYTRVDEASKREDAEKKDSSSDSSATTDPAAESSPTSSPTSSK